jgi:hypothetical protein
MHHSTSLDLLHVCWGTPAKGIRIPLAESDDLFTSVLLRRYKDPYTLYYRVSRPGVNGTVPGSSKILAWDGHHRPTDPYRPACLIVSRISRLMRTLHQCWPHMEQ